MKAGLAGLAVAVALGAVVLTSTGHAGAAACSDSIDTSSPTLWNGFGANTANTRNNPSQITSENVGSLQLALGHAAVGSTEKRGAAAVTEQAVFFSAGLRIVAINRVSGCQYWSYAIPDWPTPFGGNVVLSSAVYYLNEGPPKPALVLAGDRVGHLYALDAKAGGLVWSRFVGTDRRHHRITGAPQFYDGKMFVPVSSKEVLTTVIEFVTPCCTSHGLVQAIDPYTGSTIWTYHTSPEATFHWKERKFAPNGMSVWGTPTVDPARRAVYIGTGQNFTPPTTDNSDSIIALDLDSGRRKWVFQATAGDAYNAGCGLKPPLDEDCVRPAGPDFDFGAPPLLAQLPGGGAALIAGSKNGLVYSLNPDTGAVNWSRRIGAGGGLGGIHWGMAADSERVYAAVSDARVNKMTALPIFGLFSWAGIQLVDDATPGIYALDLMTGDVLWAARPRHSYQGRQYDSIYSAAVSVTNDVVLAGSMDGVVKAFRAADGAELWSYDTAHTFIDVNGEAGNGGTIDSVGPLTAGTDVLVNSGYHTWGSSNEFQAGPGNALFIFRLPGP